MILSSCNCKVNVLFQAEDATQFEPKSHSGVNGPDFQINVGSMTEFYIDLDPGPDTILAMGET